MKKTVLRLIAPIALAAFASHASAAELALSGNDTMKFSVTELETSAGVETTLTFTNEGTLPKAAMGHNFVLLKPGTDLATFGNTAVAAADSDYVPASLADQVIAHTKVLGPGESETITFTVAEPGEYPYICSFPGHWALMKGVLHVK